MTKAYQQRKASNARYLSKQDQFTLRLPGGCKAIVEARAAETGESVNGLINRLLRVECGKTLEEWTGKSGDC